MTMPNDTKITTIEPEILPPKPARERTEAQNAGKKPGTLARKTKTALDLAINHGVDEKTALILAHGGKQVSPGAITQFKAKVAKYRLTAPNMVKLAHNAVKDALKDKAIEVQQQAFDKKTGEVVEYTEKIAPTWTNKLAAAAMVLDRNEPVVKVNHNVNVNLDFMPIDLEDYK